MTELIIYFFFQSLTLPFKNVKSNPLKFVKSNKELKASWGTIRRQIIPKIGQLTNDPTSISRIVRFF